MLERADGWECKQSDLLVCLGKSREAVLARVEDGQGGGQDG